MLFLSVLNIYSARTTGSVFPSDKSGHPKYGALSKQEWLAPRSPHFEMEIHNGLLFAIFEVWFLSPHTVVLSKREGSWQGKGARRVNAPGQVLFPKVPKTLISQEALEKRGSLVTLRQGIQCYPPSPGAQQCAC